MRGDSTKSALWRTLCQVRRIASFCFLSALTCSLLAGCTSTSERLVGWYVTRKIDGYLDLSSQQKQSARVRVEETISELRTTELPRWVSFLREVRQGIHEGVSEDDIARLQRHYDARLDAGVLLLAPRLAHLLVALTPEQLDHFASRMREDVEELYEDLRLPPSERGAAIEKRGLRAVEDGVGELSDEQAESVRGLIRAFPNERPAQYRSALEHIVRFRRFMMGHPHKESISSELRTMWLHRYDALGPGHDQAARRALQRKWLLAVYRLLTVQQRQRAEDNVSDRIVMLKRFIIAH